VIANINFWARVAICGSISQYNSDSPEMGPRTPGFFVGRRVTSRGFIVSDFLTRFPFAMARLGKWVRTGKLKYREDIVEGGIAKAPEAFAGLLRGENFGKLQVRIGPEPAGLPKT
jgi:NADPH-dependent curcumin reductase CurA